MGVIDLSTFRISSRRRGPDIRGRLSALAESGPGGDLAAQTGDHGSGNDGRGPQALRWMPRSISLTAANSAASGFFTQKSIAESREKEDFLLGDAEVEEWGMIGFDSSTAGDDSHGLAKRGEVASSWEFDVPAKSRSLSLRSLAKYNLAFRKQPVLKRTLSSISLESEPEDCSTLDTSSSVTLDRAQCNNFSGALNFTHARNSSSGSTNLVSPSLSSSFDSKQREVLCDAEYECASETASSSECGSVVGDSESSDWSNDNHGYVASSGWKEWDVEERTSKVHDEKKQEKWISFVREFFPANRAGPIRRLVLRRFGGNRRERMHVWA
ncbi:hypothetical protein CLOM_g3910 [Closterium sp. NIES-68]|nr:hypothetical protein CLOM_g3910 [Closterium sp. NIES-68]GJP66796.1 hypothetical protein CLOP_g23699 [Closterium sp. NIES-67]